MKQLKRGRKELRVNNMQCYNAGTIPSKDAGGGGKKSAEQILLCSQDLLRALN